MKLQLDVYSERTGYGQVARGLHDALERAGVEIAPEAGVQLMVAPTFMLRDFPRGQELWCLTMWETDKLPELVVERIDNFAGIIVPNEYNLKQYVEHHPNVHLARLGIDPAVWRKVSHGGYAMKVKFLVCAPRSGGGSDIRKGINDVREAFRLAFPNPESLRPVPELTVIHTRGQYTDAELVNIFHEHHAYVSLSHGEGWHMYPFQMLATGGPVIVSAIPGHMEWASWLPGCLTVPCDMEPSPIGGVAASWTGNWWKPNIEAAAAAMRELHANYVTHLVSAQGGADQIRLSLTWRHVADEILSIIGDHERPDVDVDDRVPATKRVFPVRVLRTETVGIGDRNLRLRAGEHCDVDADQLRVLLQAGLVEAL